LLPVPPELPPLPPEGDGADVESLSFRRAFLQVHEIRRFVKILKTKPSGTTYESLSQAKAKLTP